MVSTCTCSENLIRFCRVLLGDFLVNGWLQQGTVAARPPSHPAGQFSQLLEHEMEPVQSLSQWHWSTNTVVRKSNWPQACKARLCPWVA